VSRRKNKYQRVEEIVLTVLTHVEQMQLVGAILADMVDGGRTASEARDDLVEVLDGAVIGSDAFDAFVGQKRFIH
jgi:hypothetical protein